MKTEQNFDNHKRLSFLYHGVVVLGCLATIACSVLNLIRNLRIENTNILPAIILVLLSVLLFLTAFVARIFALKAQDRAIRGEESLRYFAITGNLPPSELRLGQIIALRFAPNNELVDLTERSVRENLSSADIKKSIKNWRGDYHRV